MARGHRGSLLLRCRALPSPSPCRFIPALSMTRGRRGSLLLRRRAFPSPPPSRFIPAHSFSISSSKPVYPGAQLSHLLLHAGLSRRSNWSVAPEGYAYQHLWASAMAGIRCAGRDGTAAPPVPAAADRATDARPDRSTTHQPATSRQPTRTAVAGVYGEVNDDGHRAVLGVPSTGCWAFQTVCAGACSILTVC